MISENNIPPHESIQHRSETVIYLGMFFPVWGHVLTDNIRRMWFLKSNIFKKEFKNCPLVYVSWKELALEQYANFQRLLEIMEIDVDKFQAIKQPTQFDKIILPDESFITGREFTNEYCEMIDRVRNFTVKNWTSIPSKKIFYFHGSKQQIGEERLAEYFKSKGYDIISPEKLPLDEQLNLLTNCEIFASTLGSCSHNSMFLRDYATAIFIPREGLFSREYQCPIDRIHPLNINYVDSTLSIFDKGDRYHCYIISKQLKEFFGDKFDGYEDEDFKIFLQYVKTSINSNLIVNPIEKDYYFKFLPDFMAQLKKREDLIVACGMPPHWEQLRPSLSYQTHVGLKGWSAWISEDQISNPLDQKCDIQAIKINFPGHKVYYSVYYNDAEGWSEEISDSEMAGTTGKAKSIYGIKIWLNEAGAKEFDILYRVHKYDGTWTSWAKNGEIIYSHGVKLNAIQIKPEPKT